MERIARALEKGSKSGREEDPRLFWERLKAGAQTALEAAKAEGLIRAERELILIVKKQTTKRGERMLGFSAIFQSDRYERETKEFRASPPGGTPARELAAFLLERAGVSRKRQAERTIERATQELFEWIGEADWRLAALKDPSLALADPPGLQSRALREALDRGTPQAQGKPRGPRGL